MRRFIDIAAVVLAVCAFAWIGCGDDGDNGVEPPVDTTAPDDISDLACIDSTTTSITLTWTAPGDDDDSGTASSYQIRYSSGMIDETAWSGATVVPNPPTPQSAGSTETFEVTGLNHTTRYYFAIKSADEVPNWSEISNSPSRATDVPDLTAPGTISDVTVTSVTQTSVTLTWTAPGDDGPAATAGLSPKRPGAAAAQYAIKYSTSAITGANWNSATDAPGTPPTPQDQGATETFEVTGLTANTDYYFAVRAADEVPNWSDVGDSPVGITALPNFYHITNHAALEFGPAYSPDGERVAFVSERDGGTEIWMVSVRGEEVPGISAVQVTDLNADTQGATWSPGNDRIAFHSNAGGNYDIYVVDVSGDPPYPTPVQITTAATSEQFPDWSYDGNSIAFGSDMAVDTDIWTVSPSGGAWLAVTTDGNENQSPTWSPGDAMVAYHSKPGGPDQSIFSIPWSGGTPVRVSFEGNQEMFPDWSPDGLYVVYQENTTEQNPSRWNISYMAVNGAGPFLVSSGTDGLTQSRPAWSHDSKRVAYTHWHSGQGDIHSIEVIFP